MPRIMNIAPVPFFEDRGTPIRLYEQMSALQRLGNRIDIYTYHLGRNIKSLNVKRIPCIPWYRRASAGANYHKIYLDFMLFSKCLSDFIWSDYDIIHAYLHESVFIARGLKAFKNKPIVFDAQGSLTGEMTAHGFLKNSGFKHRFWRYIEGVAYRKADAIITSSSQYANDIMNHFGVGREKVFAIRDGVDTRLFRPRRERPTGIIPDGKKVIVYAGVLHRYQGIDCLMAAAKDVLKEVADAHFLVMGFPNVEHYRKMAKRLGVSEAFTFTGKVSYFDIPGYLSLGDVAVSPKILKSGEGNEKVYNYMSMGMPSVVFDYHVNREILGELGIYAKPEDSGSLAMKLIGILQDGKKRKSLGKRCREKAIRKYAWDNVAKEVMKVYKFVTS